MHDVLVIGGGHAGLEAAAAASRLGASTALVALDARAIGRLSCNPAIGGVGKGHLVRELHALGGLMPQLADRTGIQFRLLNTSRGPAVRGPRAQVDRHRYPVEAQLALSSTAVEVIEDEVTDLLTEPHVNGRVRCVGVRLGEAGEVRARTVVLTSGTFLGGVLHVGEERTPGGRRGEGAATALSQALQQLGLPLGRFKTGTPPRLLAESIDWELTEEQDGDAEPTFFCPETVKPSLPQVSCHAIFTNPDCHEIIREAIPLSPLAAGRITGRGPRYCPSFEEKVVRFADRERHQLILEPEGLDDPAVYLNGASTSLPAEAQEQFLRAIPALRECVITQHGYAVEYDYLSPGEVLPTLETRATSSLFVAGQVIGTTGYEEAAALGLMAGANAALTAREQPELVLGRHEGYVGVLVDDLVTRGVDEPYRMFTSRAEHRLLLGIDSADLRLAERAAAVGLRPSSAAEDAREHRERLERAVELLQRTPAGEGRVLADLARRPETDLAELLLRVPANQREALGRSERTQRQTLVEAGNQVRYEVYLRRQEQAARRLQGRLSTPIPADFSFDSIPGLSREIQERLAAARPTTLGQAARLRGVTPAALQVLDTHVARAAASVPRGTP